MGLIQMFVERHYFQTKVILEGVISPQRQIEMISEQHRILLNKIGILIIIVGTIPVCAKRCIRPSRNCKLPEYRRH